MSLGPADLVLPHFAMIDIEPEMQFVSRSFEDRCRAAAAGQFAAIGIAHTLYEAERRAGRSDADLLAMAASFGLRVSEVESISMPGPADRAVLEDNLARVLNVADVFGANRFFIIAADGVPLHDHVETFGWVADQCADHGVSVGLEFMDIPGVSALRDLRTTLDLLDRADRPNGGICLDVYHFFNGPNSWEDLSHVAREQVVMIQLSDGEHPRHRSYLDDTLRHRLPPGEGDFDLVRLVETMATLGVDSPYSVEVLNDDLRRLAVTELGERLGGAARAVLSRVGV